MANSRSHTTEPAVPTLLVQDAVCCRLWMVIAFMPVGRCGICGQRPMITGRPRQVVVPDTRKEGQHGR